MMKNILTAIVLGAVMSSAAVAIDMKLPDHVPIGQMPAGEYKNDPDHTYVEWTYDHMNLTQMRMAFRKIDATLSFDPMDVTKSKVVVKIDPLSVQGTSERFNGIMVNDDRWFQPAKFPEITFISTKIEKKGEKDGVMYGNLTIRGKTVPVALTTKFNGAFMERPGNKLPTLAFVATGKVKRSAFGLTDSNVVADDIDIYIQVEFQKPKS